MAFTPPIGSVVSFQSDPTKLVGTVSVVGILPVVLNNSSIISVSQGSIAAVIIGGSIVASFTPPANQSVSGTVGASIIGTVPIIQSGTVITSVSGIVNTAGSVVAFQGTSPWVITGSVQASFSPSGNQSVSGTVIVNQGTNPWVTVGSVQGTMSILGTVPVTQATTPWIITGSIQGSFSPSGNQSVSGTVGASIIGTVNTTITSIATVGGFVNVNLVGGSITTSSTPNQSVSGTVGASIIGLPPFMVSDGVQTLDLYEENNVDASVVGIAMMWKSNLSSSILSAVTPATPLPVSVQGIIGASIIGLTPISGTVNIGTIPGSVISFQGTSPWIVNFQNSSIIGINAGSVVTLSQGSVIVVLQNSSILAGQVGARTTSIVGGASVFQTGTWQPSALAYVTRNDTVASFLGADLTTRPAMSDAAGRMVIKPFASEDSTLISFVGSVVSGSVTLIQSSVVGKKAYITDFWISNTGATTTLVTFQGGDTSVIGKFIAPTGGGISSPGLAIPLKAQVSQDLAFTVVPSTSVLYLTLKGYQAQ